MTFVHLHYNYYSKLGLCVFAKKLKTIGKHLLRGDMAKYFVSDDPVLVFIGSSHAHAFQVPSVGFTYVHCPGFVVYIIQYYYICIRVLLYTYIYIVDYTTQRSKPYVRVERGFIYTEDAYRQVPPINQNISIHVREERRRRGKGRGIKKMEEEGERPWTDGIYH